MPKARYLPVCCQTVLRAGPNEMEPVEESAIVSDAGTCPPVISRKHR